MKKLTRQDCLSVNDLALKEYTVKAWDGVVYIKKMTAKDQIQFEDMSQGKDRKNIFSRLIVMCVCDENGNKLFTEADMDALNNKSASAVIELFTAISEINSVSQEDVEDLAKN